MWNLKIFKTRAGRPYLFRDFYVIRIEGVYVLTAIV